MHSLQKLRLLDKTANSSLKIVSWPLKDASRRELLFADNSHLASVVVFFMEGAIS
jgi:hypothetical protein